MAKQGVFTLPANINFGATAFANAAYVQVIKIFVDNVLKATFTGSGNERNLGTQIINSGKGAVRVTVDANGKPSDLVSAQLILTNKLNMAIVGSEDAGDADYNDGIAILNWPIG